jgi:hypothetical protein
MLKKSDLRWSALINPLPNAFCLRAWMASKKSLMRGSEIFGCLV